MSQIRMFASAYVGLDWRSIKEIAKKTREACNKYKTEFVIVLDEGALLSQYVEKPPDATPENFLKFFQPRLRLLVEHADKVVVWQMWNSLIIEKVVKSKAGASVS